MGNIKESIKDILQWPQKLKGKKTGIKYGKEILLDELVKEDVNASVSNAFVSACSNKENINKQLEQVRKDQHEKYQAQKSSNYKVEANTNTNSQPNQMNTEKNHQCPSGMFDSIVTGVDKRWL